MRDARCEIRNTSAFVNCLIKCWSGLELQSYLPTYLLNLVPTYYTSHVTHDLELSELPCPATSRYLAGLGSSGPQQPIASPPPAC